MKNIQKIGLVIAILLLVPLGASAEFNQDSYEAGDQISFNATADEEYVPVWFGLYSQDYYLECNVGTSTEGFKDVIPEDNGYDCNFEDAWGGIPDLPQTGPFATIAYEDLAEGTYYWLEPDSNYDCFFFGMSYTQCEAQGDYVASGSFTVSDPVQSLINEARNKFEETTGFAPVETVTWTADTLIKPFIGGGMATLYNLRYWIVALIVLSIIVFFAFRAFRFYRR